jgi:hypothetical protein
VRIWSHFERGGEAAPMGADKPGGEASGELLTFTPVLWGLRRGLGFGIGIWDWGRGPGRDSGKEKRNGK